MVTKSTETGQKSAGYKPSSGQKKVVAVAEESGVPSVLDELVELKSRKTNPYSLRELATYFNTRLVQTALSRQGGDVEFETARSVYDVITADDPDRHEEKKAEAKLASRDVDVDRLYNDFVSHHSIQTYLSDVDGVDLSKPEKSVSDREEELYQRLQKLCGRISLVTQSTLETAVNTGVIPYDEVPPNVNVTIEADCPDCGMTVSVFQLFGSRCACNSNTAEESEEQENNQTAPVESSD